MRCPPAATGVDRIIDGEGREGLQLSLREGANAEWVGHEGWEATGLGRRPVARPDVDGARRLGITG